MSLREFIETNYKESIDDIQNWCDEEYNKNFRYCFDRVRSIKDSMNSESRPISDFELEWVLTDLPLNLFTISEALNRYKLDQEVVKLKKKEIKLELETSAKELVEQGTIGKSDTKSWVDANLSEHDIVIAAFNSIVSRVESEISFSKELLMGCKKIWDSRRRAESSNPVGDVVLNPDIENLPDYTSTGYVRSTQKNSYIG